MRRRGDAGPARPRDVAAAVGAMPAVGVDDLVAGGQELVRDGDGLIEEDELMRVSPSVDRTVYTSIDTNTDGFVSYDELYGTDWFGSAIESDSILTPAYTYRYYAPQQL